MQNDFEKTFDAQILTLMDRGHGMPGQIAEIFQEQKGVVLEKASKMVIGDGNIPFIPVIPLFFYSLDNLMAMVRNEGKAGYACLDPMQIFDIVETPSGPYYIYDVADGRNDLSEKIIEQRKRFVLTVVEAIAFTVHTDALSRNRVQAAGSRCCGFGNRTPSVFLPFGGTPRLDWDCCDYSVDCGGLVSCGSR